MSTRDRPTKEKLAVIRARVGNGADWHASISCGKAAAEDAAALLAEVDALEGSPRIETCGDCRHGLQVTYLRDGANRPLGVCVHDSLLPSPLADRRVDMYDGNPPPGWCPFRKRKG